ncbi:MAG: hypothetical protein RLZZ142_2322 [Verrucomicrobiota bacterium]|jgi:RNA polymerase sigma-70 factor (ECF subfamily)
MPPLSPSEGDPLAERDIALMRLVQRGDMEAFRELVETHQHRVAGTIARMVGSGFDYAELAHEVFVRVWKSAARYEPSARFTTWLLTITRNLVLNEFRYRSRHATVPLSPLTSDPHEAASELPLPDLSCPSPDGALQEAELLEAIEKALLALPENQRTAVILRRHEGLSYEDIASVLRTSVASVKSLLFRARTQLREALREHLD